MTAMYKLSIEARQNLVQIFTGVVQAGAPLKDISLLRFGENSDCAGAQGEQMIESVLSAELTNLISLDLSQNQAFFESANFRDMALNLIQQQADLKCLGVYLLGDETDAPFLQVIRQTSLETLTASYSTAEIAATGVLEAIHEGSCF